jgi:hypothetical protein
VTDNSDPVINVLANCLDAIEQGDISPAECLRCYPQYEGELWILLQVVDILQNPPAVPVRPAFRRGARQRLVSKIAPPPRAPLGVRLRDWWRERTWTRWRLGPVPSMVRLAVGVLLMMSAALASMGGVVVAANDSLPGERLYPIKLAVEDTRLIVLSDPEDARLYLELAERRVAEIAALADQGRYEDTPATVRRYEDHIAGATRAVNRIAVYDAETAGELVARLDLVLYRTQETLSELVAAAPPTYRPVFQTAADVSQEYRVVLATLYPWEVTGGGLPTRMAPGVPTAGPAPLLPEPPTSTWTLAPTEETPSLATVVTAETLTLRPGVPGLPTGTPVPPGTTTPTLVGTRVPSSTPTPVPLPQPSDTATAVPAATWTPVPTTVPTATAPAPTSTPLPSDTPLPTSTPVPPATGTPEEPTKYPPGLTKTPEPPGLTIAPGLTNTPEPPGLTKTPEQ